MKGLNNEDLQQHVKYWAVCRGHSHANNKVITTLDDGRTHCPQSAFTHLGLWRKLYDCSLHHSTASQCVLKCALFTFSSTPGRLA